MKATDLMVGNWVYNTLSHKPEQIVEIYETQVMLWCCDLYNFDEIKPIKLTKDILSRNFKEKSCDFSYCKYKGIYGGYVGIYKSERGYWVVYIRNGNIQKGRNEICVKVKYVHELQHALRLVKINKEIEL